MVDFGLEDHTHCVLRFLASLMLQARQDSSAKLDVRVPTYSNSHFVQCGLGLMSTGQCESSAKLQAKVVHQACSRAATIAKRGILEMQSATGWQRPTNKQMTTLHRGKHMVLLLTQRVQLPNYEVFRAQKPS